jgi:hypothetical protein
MKRGIGRSAVIFCASAAGFVFLGSGPAAHAAVIGSGPVQTNMATVGPGTTVGTLGYSFPLTQPGTVENQFYYQPGGAPYETHSLPSYLSVAYASPDDYYAATGYAKLTVNGDATNGLTGYAYLPGSGATSAASAMTLATITLGPGVPASFELGVLGDNTGSAGDNTSFVITGTGGSSQTVNSPVSGNSLSDDFYYVTVTNATAGDTISIAGYNGGGGPGLAGVVFDSAAVPEPVSLGLLAVAAVPVLLRRRKI